MTPRVLLTGGAGQLAQACAPVFAGAGWDVVALDLDELDIRDHARVREVLDDLRPAVVLNLAALRDADRCEVDVAEAWDTNAYAVHGLAAACDAVGAHLTTISSDYVFGGEQDRPYVESDPAHPLSVYGETKLASEAVADLGFTVVRTAWLAGRKGANTVKVMLRVAADPERPIAFVDDQRGSPTVAEDLAPVLLALSADRLGGVFHVTNAGEATWYDLARHVVETAGYDPARVRPIATEDLDPPRAAPRPAYSVLAPAALRSAGFDPLPPWQESFARLVHDLVDGDPPA